MNERVRLVLKIALPLVFVAAGAAAMSALLEAREVPERAPPEPPRVGVQTRRVAWGPEQLTLRVRGVVEPRRRVALAPQIAGAIEWVDPALAPGARVTRGQPLARLDARELRLEVEALQAQVDRAAAQVDIERGAREVARKEWEIFAEGRDAPAAELDQRLATRQPQQQMSRADLELAQARLGQARLGLERAVVRAPFDGLVRQVQAAPGQIVGPQTPLVTLVGTQAFWVRVRVPVSQLHLLPEAVGEELPEVTVLQEAGGQARRFPARLLGQEGDVDAEAQMARALVEVPDPLGGEGPRLMLSGLAAVEIPARRLERAVSLPERAIYRGDVVYVCEPGEVLGRREVELAHRRTGSALVVAGLEPGDRVVTTRLAAPIEGMRLTCHEGEQGEVEGEADGDEPANEGGADE